ncbi:MAG TPA: hypothetical protein VFR14_09845 [Candidatus Limnocylindrales bacterium]|nr:hypothetical protein [Candidatus Limnocylindrales bacterium]
MPADSAIIGLTVAGIATGVWLLIRGFGSRLDAARIADTATSSIASIALGEVRVSGTVEPAEVLLTSPLQDLPCVYYRARIDDARGDASAESLDEERSVGFRVRDATGSLRVFPRGARWEVPDRFDESSSIVGDQPFGLRMRTRSSGRPARYREARVEPDDIVTVVGRVVPFAELPVESAGPLHTDPPASWGNAAIPGFGIGRPVKRPHVDPQASAPPLATAAEEADYAETFDLAPDSLVLASDPDVPLVIAFGSPAAAVARHEERYAIGLLGAVLAIGSAVALALVLGGGVAR